MVRTVHTNHFYEILAQISDPKIEFSTKTHFLKNDHVQNFWKLTFWPEKSPCGVVPQQNKGCKHIPDHSRPNSDQIISQNINFYNKFVENRGFSIKIAKKFKIVAKALLRAPTTCPLRQSLFSRALGRARWQGRERRLLGLIATFSKMK